MKKVTASEYKARFRRRSTHVPNLTDELSTAKERRLNQKKLVQLGSAHEKYGVWARPKKPLNTGQFYSNSGAYESDRLMQVHST